MELQTTANIVVLLALCYLAWGLFHAVFVRRLGINYTRRFSVTTVYFLCFAALIFALFSKEVIPVVLAFSLAPLVVLLLLLAAQLALFVILPRRVARPVGYLTENPGRYFLEIDWRRLISKSADIVAQQVFIIALVQLLAAAGFALPELILSFGILFILLHVPLIVREWGKWPAWLFAGIVIFFSIIFPPLILYVPSGYLYNIALHWLFYSATAMFFWIHHSRQSKKIVV